MNDLKKTPSEKSSKSKTKKKKKASLGLEFKGLTQNIFTLLDIPGRKPLPPLPTKGRPSKLAELADYNPDGYKNLIGMMREGASGNSAAEKMGISEHTFYDWAKRGRQDHNEDRTHEDDPDYVPIDTYFYRFYMDVRRAVAGKRVDCEIRIAECNPRMWLTNGPGKIFGDNWVDKPAQINGPPSHNNGQTALPVADSPQTILDSSYALISQEEEEGSEESISTNVIHISDDYEQDALAALEEAGIVKLSRQYKRESKKQADEDTPIIE